MIVDFLYHLCTCTVTWFPVIFLISCILLLHVIIKNVWNFYIMWYCVTDTELDHLPIPPGTLGYPFIGETVEFIIKNDKFYKKRQDQYGNVYRTHVLGRPTIRVTGAHNLRNILLSENSYVSSQWPPSIRKVLGPYALSMMDDITEHKERKKLLLNLFQPDALNAQIPIIRSAIRQYIELWCEKKQILGYPECRNLAFTISMRSLAGFDCDDKKAGELSSIFQTMVENMFSLPVDLPGFGLYKALKAKKYLITKIEENIKTLQRTPVDNGKNCSALDYLLREEDEACRYKTCESMVELMFASHDTTSSAFSSCLMHLGKYPHVLEKLRQEIDPADLSDEITLQSLEKYKYLYFVTKEVLRVTPPVGAGYRKVLKSFEVEGYKIPKGWTVAYGIRDTHHTAPVYLDPTNFNPDRWETLPSFERMMTNNSDERFNYAPFGGGPRTCVGKEFAKLTIKLFLYEICKKCDWTLRNKDADLKYIPVPRAADNLPMSIKRRKI